MPTSADHHRRRQLNVRLTPETELLLEAIKERDGTPYSVQISRAMRLFARERNVPLPAPPPLLSE